MKAHPESWIDLAELGQRMPPYLPTYEFASDFIDRMHGDIAGLPLRDGFLIRMRGGGWFPRTIKGWLRREDALKLYELAYFAGGDVLELGSHHGLSTAIIATACRNGPVPKHVDSVDLDPAHTRATRRTVRSLGLLDLVTTRTGDAAAAVRGYVADRRQFAFVFIDHSHSYADVHAVCRELGRLTTPGGFCLFHDYNDSRNRDEADEEYGVFQAIADGLDGRQFEFYGVYGCTALYRRRP